jgi:hypothetical protein
VHGPHAPAGTVAFGALVGAAMLVGGCFPLRAQIRSHQTGQVIEQTNGRPIAGARVIVESWQVQAPPGDSSLRELLHTVEVETDATGRWEVPEERDWKLAILAADGFPLFRQSACVVVPGFTPFVVDPFSVETARPTSRTQQLPEVVALESAEAVAPAVKNSGTSQSKCGVPLEPRLDR